MIRFLLLFSFLIFSSFLLKASSWRLDGFALRSDSLVLDGHDSGGVSFANSEIEVLDSMSWTIYIQLDFSPSANNQLTYYFFANDSVVSDSLSGFYMEIGENGSQDGLSFYRLNGGKKQFLTKLAAGELTATENKVKIEVRKCNDTFHVAVVIKGELYRDSLNYAVQNSRCFQILKTKYTSSNKESALFFEESRMSWNFSDKEQGLKYIRHEGRKIYYLIGDIGFIFDSAVFWDSQLKSVSAGNDTLVFELASDIVPNVLYEFEVVINGVFGECGFAGKFRKNLIARGQLVVNELMVDPISDFSSSEIVHQFIELRSISNEVVFTDGLLLCINDHCFTIANQKLEPESYLVLSESGLGLGLGASINVLEVKDWLDLPKGEGCVSLVNQEGELVDRVCYHGGMLSSDYRSKGGYSIEREEGRGECGSGLDYSLAFEGSTPGVQNSITGVDEVMFSVSKLSIDSNLLSVRFSQPISENWIIKIEPQVDFVVNKCKGVCGNELQVRFGSGRNEMHQIYLEVENYCGDIYRDTVRYSALGDVMKINALWINEVMYDPKDGFAEYFELYNGGDEAVCLSDLVLGVGAGEGLSIDGVYALADEGAFIAPGDYHVFHKASSSLQNFKSVPKPYFVHSLGRFPQMSNSGGELKLLTKGGKLLDSVYFENGLHSSVLKETKGVALERHLFGNSMERVFWTSANAESLGGTPGFSNSNIGAFSSLNMALSQSYYDYSEGKPITLEYDVGPDGAYCSVSLFDQNTDLVTVVYEGEVVYGKGSLVLFGEGKVRSAGLYALCVEMISESGKKAKLKEVLTIR